MREQNPNINVRLVAMECELHQVRARIRTLSRILNQSGFKRVRPRRNGILTASDIKNRVAYAAKAVKNT